MTNQHEKCSLVRGMQIKITLRYHYPHGSHKEILVLMCIAALLIFAKNQQYPLKEETNHGCIHTMGYLLVSS